MSKIGNFLEEMGYQVLDTGQFYRCKALYRGGDNPTALSINTETGVWCDFVAGVINAPFESLIKLTTGKEDSSILENYLNKRETYVKPRANTKSDYMKNDYFDSKILSNLLNNYAIYEEKGISRRTQEQYLCGYAGSGAMYGRIVFPIFDESKNIIGFSGRDALSREGQPKWKHIGKKKNFIYPYLLPQMKTFFMEGFEEKEEIILVESIGDSMALFENGIPNNLVTFGLAASSSLLALVNSLSPSLVTIAFNNDKSSNVNRGLIGAIKSWIKFSSLIGKEKVQIKLPLLNDFGDMAENDKSLFIDWKEKEIDKEKQLNYIEKIIVEKPRLFTEEERKIAKKILWQKV